MTIHHEQGTQRTGITSIVPPAPARYHDPAEYIDFARPVTENFLPYDVRGEKELGEVARHHESPLERERALWELADRQGAPFTDLLTTILRSDSSRDVRQSALWLALKTFGAQAHDVFSAFRDDADPEVADWARVLDADITGRPAERVYARAVVEETGHFDQTVPLVISGNVIIDMPGVGPARAVLSPLWFDSILGRVLASTNTSTIRTDLTVEKELEGLHADGSKHYEIFPFRGMSVEYSGDILEHNYISDTLRPFFPSGIVDDGESVDVPVALMRVAITALARQGQVPVLGDGPRAERVRAAEFSHVQSVRGRFFGWAAVNLPAVFDAGTVKAGHVQLSNPTDPVAGPMTNAKLYGTFRGKSGDYTGAGAYTLNSIKCHGRADGGIQPLTGGAEHGN